MKTIRSLVSKDGCVPGVFRVFDPNYLGGDYRYFYSYKYALAFAKKLSNKASTRLETGAANSDSESNPAVSSA